MPTNTRGKPRVSTKPCGSPGNWLEVHALSLQSWASSVYALWAHVMATCVVYGQAWPRLYVGALCVVTRGPTCIRGRDTHVHMRCGSECAPSALRDTPTRRHGRPHVVRACPRRVVDSHVFVWVRVDIRGRDIVCVRRGPTRKGSKIQPSPKERVTRSVGICSAIGSKTSFWGCTRTAQSA